MQAYSLRQCLRSQDLLLGNRVRLLALKGDFGTFFMWPITPYPPQCKASKWMKKILSWWCFSDPLRILSFNICLRHFNPSLGSLSVNHKWLCGKEGVHAQSWRTTVVRLGSMEEGLILPWVIPICKADSSLLFLLILLLRLVPNVPDQSRIDPLVHTAQLWLFQVDITVWLFATSPQWSHTSMTFPANSWFSTFCLF